MALLHPSQPYNHWEQDELPFTADGVEYDLLGLVSISYDNGPDSWMWQYAGEPDCAVFITPKLIHELRPCHNPDAMTHFRAYLWARRGNRLKYGRGGRFLVPALDVFFAFLKHDGKTYGFAYTCIGGTCIPVDLAEAAAAAMDAQDTQYATAGLHFAPKHEFINPDGGRSTLVRDIWINIGSGFIIYFTHAWDAAARDFVPMDIPLVETFRGWLRRAVKRVRAGDSVERCFSAGMFLTLDEENGDPMHSHVYDGFEDVEAVQYVPDHNGYYRDEELRVVDAATRLRD
ncbi:hypothetical protein C8A01DRAFT_41526 [Parachaetomium inaequale]|uniref:Uncharacterized protein n=1 Tax=Parachaetomium inaequale TaxID=2588326 RepID=A0AAN6P728_9PEZI|nr:hypothetical protein C8A01DRAFT_41526 [Parachaetomium inaequale]